MWIFQIFFALALAAGGLTAWRRSPLYSLKITLELIGALMLLAGGVVLITQGILSDRLSRSPVTQGILGFVALLVISTLSMMLIVRITDRHVAKLPPATRLVTFNRNKVTRWVWRMVAYLVISAVLSLLLPHDWSFLPLGIAAFVLLICGPMLAIFYMMARRNDLGMTSVMANPWAHWQYTSEQWSAWAENQRRAELASSVQWKWKPVTLFILFCSALLCLGAIFTDGPAREKITIVSFLSGGLILLIFIVFLGTRGSIDRHYRALLAAAPETWLGDEGVFGNGSYTPWLLSGKFLTEASLEPIPDLAEFPAAILVLTFEAFRGNTTQHIFQRLPIPPGHLSEITPLLQKLKLRCPLATIRMSRP